MLIFGLLTSVFDYLTFGVLLYWMKAGQMVFQTGWFIESVVSAALIVLVVRTRLPFLKSPPGKYLAMATVLVVALVVGLPFMPVARVMGFVRMPWLFYDWMLLIVALYIGAAEAAKHWFYKSIKNK